MLDYRLDKHELAELRAAHRGTRDVREAYRINAVILLGKGRAPADVADALLIDQRLLATTSSVTRRAALMGYCG